MIPGEPATVTGRPDPFLDLEAIEAAAVAAAVRDCPGVIDLAAGPFGWIGTYRPGGVITGVRLDESTIDIHLVAGLGVPLPLLADRVRGATGPMARGREINVRIEEVRLPTDGTTAPAGGPPRTPGLRAPAVPAPDDPALEPRVAATSGPAVRRSTPPPPDRGATAPPADRGATAPPADPGA